MKKKHMPEQVAPARREMPRCEPAPDKGLTSAQARALAEDGSGRGKKSYRDNQ